MRSSIIVACMTVALNAVAVTKSYQVTGPVVDVKDDSITVQKGNERWEIAQDPSTKGAKGVKVGDKVTIDYRMQATDVEVKTAKGKTRRR